jgi:hypothetical protein
MLVGHSWMARKVWEVQPGVLESSRAMHSRWSAVPMLMTMVRRVPAFMSMPWNQARE